MKNILRYIAGYIIGILSVIIFWAYILNFHLSYGKEVIYEDDIASIKVEAQETPDYKHIILFSNTTPLFSIEYDKKDKKIYKAGIYDRNEKAVGVFYLTDGELDGLELLKEDDIPFYQMSYDSKARRWQEATYCDKTSNNTFVGDFYTDLNVDGQFDIMDMFDQRGNAGGTAIFFNNAWHVAELSDDDLSAKAYIFEENERTEIDLVFDFEEGWIPSDMTGSKDDLN